MPARRQRQAPPRERVVTPADVREMVSRIGAHSRDDLTATTMEYQLYRAVIAAIASGAPMAAELAREAIRSQQWGFERWTDGE